MDINSIIILNHNPIRSSLAWIYAPMGDGVFGILVHLGIRLAEPLCLKDGVPAKVSRASGSDDAALCPPDKHNRLYVGTWVRPEARATALVPSQGI